MNEKLNQVRPEQTQQTEPQLAGTPPGAREFSSVEELLRYDASQVAPPASVAARLQDSLTQQAPTKRPWWKRWFFGG